LEPLQINHPALGTTQGHLKNNIMNTKKCNSLAWFNIVIESLDKRLKSSDFDYMQTFAAAVAEMEYIQKERERIYKIPAEIKKYTW